MINFVQKDGKKSSKSMVAEMEEHKENLSEITVLCNEGRFRDALNVLYSIESYYKKYGNLTIDINNLAATTDIKDTKVIKEAPRIFKMLFGSKEVLLAELYNKVEKILRTIKNLEEATQPVRKEDVEDLKILLNFL